MAIAFVGAGAGAEQLVSGTGSVSKTGCTAGNIIIFHGFMGADSGQDGFTNFVNTEGMNGADGVMDDVSNAGNRQVLVGRVIANGTVSADMFVGAAGDDFVGRVYEFSGGSTSTTFNGGVFENINTETGLTTSTTVTDADVTTLGVNRLAMNFVNIRSANAVGVFTGQSGGTWAEAISEYNGTTLTLQLQTAAIPTAGVIDGGSVTITSAFWVVIGTALIAAPEPPVATVAWLRA